MCRLVAPARVVVLYTNAPPLRWGAHCAGVDVSGEFPPGLQAKHIGVKELFAIWQGLLALFLAVHRAYV